MHSVSYRMGHWPWHLQNWAPVIHMIMTVTNHTIYFCIAFCRNVTLLSAFEAPDPARALSTLHLLAISYLSHHRISPFKTSLLHLHLFLHAS
jgi:uncharacterized membrane protein YwaF